MSNDEWIKRVTARTYRAYYRQQYDQRDSTMKKVLNRGGKK
jgi:hypothetical protein